MKNTTSTPLFGSESQSGRLEEETPEDAKPPVLGHLAGAAVVFLAAGVASVVQRVIRNRRRDAR